jgi:hypothetical protein
MEGLSKSFNIDIKVKQGYPLSPKLFTLYIVKIHEWIKKKVGEGCT